MIQSECIGLNEVEGKVWLRADVNAEHIETGLGVTHGGTARATE